MSSPTASGEDSGSIGIKKAPGKPGASFLHCTAVLLEAVVDLGEDVADDRAKQGEDGDHDDGDQDEDQSVLNQTLAFGLRSE